MDDTQHRALIHQINNLLGSIHAQVAAARAAATEDAARRALDIIERSAHRTEAVVQRARESDSSAG